MIQLFNIRKEKIAGLIEYKDLSIESVLESGDKTLSFLYPKRSKFYDEIVEEVYIRTKTDEFVIKEKNLQGDYTNFVCKLNVEDLEGNPFDRFESIEQTITNALNLALVGTSWSVKDNSIKKKRTVRKTNCSSWEIVQEIKKTYRVDIVFNTLEKEIEVFEHLGEDKGTYFIDSLNLKALQVQGNSYDYATRMIPVGKDGLTIEAINNGKNYVENYQYSNKLKTVYWKDERYTIVKNLKEDAEAKLEEISKPYRAYTASTLNLAKMNDKYKNILDYKLGDTITLISKDNNIKEKQRIVKTKEYKEDHSKDTVELANSTLKFEDIQKQFQDTSDTVDNITSDNGTIDGSTIDGIKTDQIEDFKANVIEAAEIHAIRADFQDLNATVGRFGQVISTKVNTTQLEAVESKLNHALIGKADVTEMNVAVERVGILEGKTLSVENQLAGNLTAKNFHTNSITAGSGIIANGAIGDAQISSLSGNKLNFGTVDTSKVTIAGPNGRFRIVGNKLQILDSTDGKLYERIMLGIDDNNNSALSLRGKDGKTTLINQDGLTDAGFTEGYGKVNDNSLDAKKFDKNSIVREVNGATEAIKGTKVQIGDRTLDVELSTQKNTITDQGRELSTQKAIIQALDNAIKLKVDNQTFTQSTNTINGNINNINSDLIGKINTSLNNAKSYADSKKQEAINSASTDATNKSNNALNSAKEFTTAQITTTNSNLSKATSEINILKGQISTKVSQSDIDKTVNNIKFGGRNLLTKMSEYTQDNKYTITATRDDHYIHTKGMVNLVEGQSYTFSMKTTGKMDSSNSTDSVEAYLLLNGQYQTIIGIAQNPKTFTCTHTGEYQLRLDVNQKGKTHSFWDIKIESGTIASGWSPAPEDINQDIIDSAKKTDEKITQVSTELKQTKDSLQASVNSLNSTTQTITTNLTNTTNSLNNKEDKNSRVIFARGTGNDYPANSCVKIGNVFISNGQGRGLRIIALDPNTLKQVFLQDYDTYGDGNAIVKFNNKINELNNGNFIIVITSEDASYPLTCKESLQKIGATLYTSDESTYREAYALIGKSKLGKGNGVEMFIPKTANDKRFAEVAVKIDENGNLLGVSKANLQSYSDYVSTKKANTAQSNAVTHADNVATSKSNEALNNAKTYTNAQITTVNTRVSNAESSINILKGQISTKVSQSDIDKTVNNIKFGGRNYFRGSQFNNTSLIWLSPGCSIDSNFKYKNNNSILDNQTGLTSDNWRGVSVKNNTPMNAGDVVSGQIMVYIPNGVTIDRGINLEIRYYRKDGSRITQSCAGANTNIRDRWQQVKLEGMICPEGTVYADLYPYITRNGKCWFAQPKLENGSKCTDYSVAPEDIGQEIKDNIQIVTQKINTAESSFTQKTNSISQKVTQVESTTNSLNGKVTSNTNRISNAESKITPNAIVNSVNSSLVNGTTIGTSMRLTNRSFTVSHSDRTKVVIEDGMLKTFDNGGMMSSKLGNNQISFYDWIDNTGDIMGTITTSKLGNEKGLAVYAGDYANYLSLGFDEVWGEDGKYASYLEFRKKSVTKLRTDLSFEGHGITNISSINDYVETNTNINNIVIRGNQVNTNTSDNILWLNRYRGPRTKYQDGTVRIGNSKGNGDHGALICQSLYVHGDKHNIINTKELGFIGVHAYEMAEPQYGDNGGGTINQDGYCYIYIDAIFSKTVNTNINYRVHIDIISDDLNSKVQCSEKTPTYFKVIGTPGTQFDWEIKCKKRGSENKRLDRIKESVIVESQQNNNNLNVLDSSNIENYDANKELLTKTLNYGIDNNRTILNTGLKPMVAKDDSLNLDLINKANLSLNYFTTKIGGK